MHVVQTSKYQARNGAQNDVKSGEWIQSREFSLSVRPKEAQAIDR